MSDRGGARGFDPNSLLDSLADRRARPVLKEAEESEEQSCAAFGYLRGIREQALMLELRFRNGNREFYPYGLLGPVRYNPSVGLLLRYSGDVVTLVLIRGSNLDALVHQGAVNLTDRGIQRHRILWIREMDEAELCRPPKGEPTIDRIEVGEFESHEALREWLEKKVPAFVRPNR
jgi:hypothetical protein